MRQQMTSRERVLAVFRGEPYDRTPLISPTSLANTDCMKISHAYFPYANLNSYKMAALAETSYTVLGFDSIMPYFGMANEASAFGCDVGWGGMEKMPTIYGRTMQSVYDFKTPSNYLDQKPVRVVIDAIARLKKYHQGQVALIGKVIGPLSLLFCLYGIQNTLLSLILDPDAIRQVLRELRDTCIEFAAAQIDAGADIITVSEDAVGDMISKECYQNLVMEAEKGVAEVIGRDAHTILHLNCDITDRADLFCETGFHALSYDSRNDLVRLKSLTGNMKLIGGVNNPVTLLNGTQRDVIRDVHYALQNGVSFIAPESAIPLRTTNENLLAMRKAVCMFHGVGGG